jgi:phenylalanyl-tRNA synthetase beta chain
VDALAHNRRREQPDVRLFETGSCFDTSAGERRRVAFVWMGRAAAEHWSQPSRSVDFFDARGVVERFAEAFGAVIELAPAQKPGFVPGRTAEVRGATSSAALGTLGQLQPSLLTTRDVPPTEDVYAAELDLEALAATARGEVHVEPLPRFPSIGRDLSILVSDGLPAADVRGTIRSAAPATLATLREFDRYQGKGIPEGRVSLSYHLTFRAPERTLTDAEVDEAMARIVKTLEDRHGASRR